MLSTRWSVRIFFWDFWKFLRILNFIKSVLTNWSCIPRSCSKFRTVKKYVGAKHFFLSQSKIKDGVKVKDLTALKRLCYSHFGRKFQKNCPKPFSLRSFNRLQAVTTRCDQQKILILRLNGAEIAFSGFQTLFRSKS